jgi:23S rRNA (adenine2503-C2)-methyltransferase
MAALKEFHHQTRSKLSFEYIAFHQFNDTLEDAAQLAKLCKHFPVRVNIIEYNPIDSASYSKSSEDRIDAFAAYLVRKGVTTTVRRSRGKDIDAACGQLANK